MSTKHFKRYLEEIENKEREKNSKMETKMEEWTNNMNKKRNKKNEQVDKKIDLEEILAQSDEDITEEELLALERMKKRLERNKADTKRKQQRKRKKRGGKNKKKKNNPKKKKITTNHKKKNEKKKVEEVEEEDDLEFLNSLNNNQKESSKKKEPEERKYPKFINKKSLNPMKEFRSILKDKSLTGNNLEATRKRHREFTKVHFVTSKMSWHKYRNPGLSMDIIDSSNPDFSTYTFTPSRLYENLQNQFHLRVNSHDPGAIFELLLQSPWHADTLLAVAEIYYMRDELEPANEMIEKAMYTFERSMSKSFTRDLFSGRARLSLHPPSNRTKNPPIIQSSKKKKKKTKNIVDPYWRINRSFLLCLWKRCHAVGLQGTCGTALENSIVLHSICPSLDPCHILLVLDYFALRSLRVDRFLEFLEHIEKNHDIQVSDFLNLSFSKALICFLSIQKKKRENNNNNNKKEEEEEKLKDISNIYLQSALYRFPYFLPILLDKIILSNNNNKNNEEIIKWSELLRGTIFRDYQPPKSQELFIECYLERCGSLWISSSSSNNNNNHHLLNWIFENVKELLKDIGEDPFVVRNSDEENRSLWNYRNVFVGEVMGKNAPRILTESNNSANPQLIRMQMQMQQQQQQEINNPIFQWIQNLFSWQ